jgi:hypothetical protein
MMTPWKRPYLFPLFAIAAAAVLGLVVMLLWNAIIPGLTHWEPITYINAVGLLVLCRVLFGGFGRRHGGWRHGGPPWRHHAEWRQKWMNMTEEERNAMRERWKQRCGPPWMRGGTSSDQPQ